MIERTPSCIAFHGTNCFASGSLGEVVVKAKELLNRDTTAQVLIFDDLTSEMIDLDFRVPPAQADTEGSESPAPGEGVRRPGRPKLGVVAREVTLLPRHWEWLASQPGGASVALRKLVEHGIKANRTEDSLRRAREATYRFLSAMAGNEPLFEEAIRALFGGRQTAFHSIIEPWPADVRDHAKKLAANAFAGG
ncbi:MAG: DUF2239 family protein [Bryobacteraceae bacterium]